MCLAGSYEHQHSAENHNHVADLPYLRLAIGLVSVLLVGQ